MNLSAPEFVPKNIATSPKPVETTSNTANSDSDVTVNPLSHTTNPLLVPTITNIANGRVLTSMNIRLNPSQGNSTHRNTKKLDLTGRRHTIATRDPIKFDVKVDDEQKTLKSLESSDSSTPEKPMRVQKYSRSYLMSSRENKMSLQLPNLPNIP